jgi:hypothetical protein
MLPLAALVVAVGGLLAGMVARSRSGQPPAVAEVRGGRLHVTLPGAVALYGLRSRVEVPLDDVVGARVEPRARDVIDGLRVGTHLPGVLTAGTFHRFGGKGRDLVAVYRGAPAVVVEIRPGRHRYRRLILEVADPETVTGALTPVGA